MDSSGGGGREYSQIEKGRERRGKRWLQPASQVENYSVQDLGFKLIDLRQKGDKQIGAPNRMVVIWSANGTVTFTYMQVHEWQIAMDEALRNLRDTLKTLCCLDGWSYAVFWRFHPHNSTLLNMEDAYYEDPLAEGIVNKLPQVHLLGEGIIGQTASTGKYRWMHSDHQTEESNLTICEQVDSDLHQQFSSGIKTIVVISVDKPSGVIQFGSKKKIMMTINRFRPDIQYRKQVFGYEYKEIHICDTGGLVLNTPFLIPIKDKIFISRNITQIMERIGFLEQTQRLLTGIENEGVLSSSANTLLSPDSEDDDLYGLLASFSAENLYDGNLKYVHCDNSEVLMGNTYSSANPDDSFPSMYNILEEGMNHMHGNSSCLGDQLTPAIEAQVLSSDRDNITMILKPGSSMNNSIDENPSFGTWSSEISSLDDTLGQQLVSEINAQDIADVHCKEANAFSYDKLAAEDPALTSLYGMNRLLDPTITFPNQLGNSVDNQLSVQSSILSEVNFPDSSSKVNGPSMNLEPIDTFEEFPELFSADDLSQLLALSPDDSIDLTVTALNNTLSKSQEFNPISSSLVDSSVFGNVPVTCSTVHNSIADTVNLDNQQASTVMHSSGNILFDSLGLDLTCDKIDEWWANMLTPMVSTAATNTTFSISKSELNVASGSRKKLFSELGLDGILNGQANSNALNIYKEQLSTYKKQKIEHSTVNRNPIQLPSLALSRSSRVGLLQPVSKVDRISKLVPKKEIFQKPEVGGLRIDDRHGNTRKVVPTYTQKPVEPNKVIKKRAKPGETTRPRPKDRQLIQERIEKLRMTIPNCGTKISIDALLSRTISFMVFLQSITKHADRIHEPCEPKLIKDTREGDSINGGGGGGVTCAFEMTSQTMVCPIIVEDMGSPGVMLIEMLYEERGSLLEIVDKIKGIGLKIVKGNMETREKKIWAHFIVEVKVEKDKRPVTRIEVFRELLQQANTFGTDYKHSNAIEGVYFPWS
ncbi:uncharacterized protein LOC133304308 [Gastrolobium bilobum]|uniref:uncharacterized protein LOC133304308 n=1 Tax=Gastrolobium bilobum TaxID=150636 RepID=UPI002AB219B5|nr:uncharacterized protein LOC133304308 [Gastrolobium bilobum]